MQKKVMAVAVAGALGALAAPVAVAQTSTVQIGGSIHLIYVQSRARNSVPVNALGQSNSQNHDNLHTSEPELFFRGEEQVGGGNAFWFQCTSTLDVLGVGTMNSTGAGDGWCGRNSAIGFKGSWGNLFFGNWDDPHKLMVTPIRGWFGLNNVFARSGALLWNTPGSDVVNGASSFHRRVARSINYHSPSWGGFAFRGAYSAQNEATDLASNGLGNKPRLWAADVTYTSGPLYLGAAYERHKNFNPGAIAIGAGTSAYSGGTDSSWVVGGSYTFGGFLRIGGVYTRNEWDIHNTGGMKNHGWWGLFDWTIAGPHSLKGQYAKRSDTKGNVTTTIGNLVSNDVGGVAGRGTGGKVYGLQYAYEFSKRTTAYLGFNRTKGDSGSKDTNGTATASLGQAQTVYGFGLRHRF